MPSVPGADPSAAPAAAPGLPPAVPLLAALGLGVLLLCTVPAVHAQRQLEGDHARAARDVRQAEERVESLRRELDRGAEAGYLRIKATRTLLHRGATYIRDRDEQLRQRGR